jgi:polyphenol oxidase
MTFDVVNHNGISIGYQTKNKSGLFFFGFQNCTTDILSALYPDLHFYKAQQVHGTALAKAPFTTIPQADAVWSSALKTAPTVITADCLPVLVLHPHFCAAIHAGWRGVLSEIVPKSIAALLSLYPGPSEISVCIGPHIQAQSFEVGLEVINIFQEQLSYFSMERHTLPHTTSGKSYINLNSVVSDQLAALDIMDNQITRLTYDTLSDTRWASFRRDKQRNLRNFSFVARLK